MLLPLVSTLYKVPQLSSMNREQFSQWFTGFIDAEGNFQVWLDGPYLRVAFRIRLHVDDIAVLYQIKTFLGVGTVNSSGNSAYYVLQNPSLLLKVLVPFLDQYSLRTTKLLDYIDFKAMLKLLTSSVSSRMEGANLALVNKTVAGMNQGRSQYDYSLLPTAPINPFWFLGFVEGEGTFGIKNMAPYFQVGQHIRNTVVLDAIVVFLTTLPNGFSFTHNSNPVSVGSVVNKRTDVKVLSINNVDVLHDTLAYFFLEMPFQTRKQVDFLYWCIVLYMHKFGHFYLPEGRALAVSIANYINGRRYTNAAVAAVMPVINPALFEAVLPVQLTPTITHVELAKAFARLVTSRQIYVYDNGSLVPGSPFSSQPSALEAIGESKRSSAVKRNIDTGKAFKERFTFYSAPKADK